MLRAPGRLLGAVGGGSGGAGGGEDEDGLGAGGSFSAHGLGMAARGASLADMWIDFLQAQIETDEGGADGASFGAAAAAMARGEGPDGVAFLGSPHAPNGSSFATAAGSPLQLHVPPTPPPADPDAPAAAAARDAPPAV